MARLGELAALRMVFALSAAGFATWFPRIPDVKAALDVDLFTLSICFFMLPAGTLLGFAIAPIVLAKIGTREASRGINALFILSFIAPAFATSPFALGAALFLSGGLIAQVEVAMNARAGEIERRDGRRVMASCHAYWSLGAMAGALIGGAAGALGIGFALQQVLVAPVIALLAFAVGSRLTDRRDEAPAAAPKPRLRLDPSLRALCVLPMAALLIEGAMMDWSALFLEAAAGAGPAAAGLVFALFSLAMAATRFLGDSLIERHGPRSILILCAVLGAVGVGVFATAGTVIQAALGAVITALGVANVYPIAMSIAGSRDGRQSEAAIAIVASAAFSVYLIGPPAIGAIADRFGLGAALLATGPLSLLPLLLLRWVAPAERPLRTGAG
ncbi:MAG: MFS transporter [Pseudomonadota bacterium]